MNICFDFDGPIIDVTDRYYRAYLESLKGVDPKKLQILTKEDFWLLKQNRITDFEIGVMTGLSISEALESAEIRKDLSFKFEYLSLDKLFSDVVDIFDLLKKQNIIFFTVTLRRNKQLMHAIKLFKLGKYLTDEQIFSLPDNQKFTNDIQEKYILLVNAVNKMDLDPENTWLIGDSETDMHSGKLAKYGKIILISRGIRSREQLEILRPDYLVNNLREAITILNSSRVVA